MMNSVPAVALTVVLAASLMGCGPEAPAVTVDSDESLTPAPDDPPTRPNALLDDYDDQVKAAYRYEGTPSEAVSRALYYRFLKRITAHLMNFLTSLIMPIDRLDYYDEDKADR